MLLDVTDRLVVIVGGGSVAARKAAGLIAAGARHIRCVAPAFCDDLPPAVQRIAEAYAQRHLAGASIAFAATDRHDVNDAVVHDARKLGVLVNRADSDEAVPGDFSTPAKLEEGAVLVTVSAGSAALAAAIRDDLRGKLDRRFVRMAEAVAELRPAIRACSPQQARRAQVWRDLAGEEALDVLDTGGMEAVRTWLKRRYPELTHG